MDGSTVRAPACRQGSRGDGKGFSLCTVKAILGGRGGELSMSPRESLALNKAKANPMVPDITDLPRAIQLALTPVFLVSGIAGLLAVMTGRLSRIIDRGRALARGDVALEYVSLALERQALERRRQLAAFAITATTIAALLVCVVIASLFVEVMLQTPSKWLISAFFAGAMVTLVVGLAFFVREVHLATHTVRIDAPRGEVNAVDLRLAHRMERHPPARRECFERCALEQRAQRSAPASGTHPALWTSLSARRTRLPANNASDEE